MYTNINVDDDVILPFKIGTDNDSGVYKCKAKLVNGDKIKPRISGIATTANIIVDSASI